MIIGRYIVCGRYMADRSFDIVGINCLGENRLTPYCMTNNNQKQWQWHLAPCSFGSSALDRKGKFDIVEVTKLGNALW